MVDGFLPVRVDVVVPVYRPDDWLGPCLESVRSARNVAVRLFVVDDSPDGSSDSWRNLSGAVVVHMRGNRGFAAATNRGIAAGNAPYVLCLNQDARIAPNFLERLLPIFAADPRVAAASGKVLHVPGPLAPPDGAIDTAGLAMRRGRHAVDLGQGTADGGQFDGRREVFGVSAAVALYRRSALDCVAWGNQVFEERFVMYKEDVDLAWRLRRAGFRAVVDGSAIAFHGRSVAALPAARGLAARAAGLWRQERRKPRWARRLAWRNQLLMVVQNDTPADFWRSAVDILAREVALVALGLMLDPIGTAVDRLRLPVEVGAALRTRRARQAHRAVDLRDWLP